MTLKWSSKNTNSYIQHGEIVVVQCRDFSEAELMRLGNGECVFSKGFHFVQDNFVQKQTKKPLPDSVGHTNSSRILARYRPYPLDTSAWQHGSQPRYETIGLGCDIPPS